MSGKKRGWSERGGRERRREREREREWERVREREGRGKGERGERRDGEKRWKVKARGNGSPKMRVCVWIAWAEDSGGCLRCVRQPRSEAQVIDLELVLE